MEEETSIANHPVLVDINAACAAIEAYEVALKNAKRRLHEVIAELPSKIADNEDLREEIIYHLYWFDDRIPKNTLKQAFNVVAPANAGKKSNVIRSLTIDLRCGDCQQMFQRGAKSLSDSRWEMGVCDGCQVRRKQSIEGQKQGYSASTV